MARIGLTLSGIERRLLASLAAANAEITMSAYRTATGHKINAASDDPSAFARLSGLQSQLVSVTATLNNATAAGSVIAQVQTAISSIQTQLTTIRTELLKDENQTLTEDERAEAQANIDAAITQINNLAAGAINGRALLSGAANYRFDGLDASEVAEVNVYHRVAAGQTISGSVTSTATQAQLVYTGNASNQVTANATFTLTGNRGSYVLSVTSGQALSDVADTLNAHSHTTGVTAAVDTDAHTLTFTSVDYGSPAIAQIQVSVGTFTVTGGDGSGNAAGTDAAAVINGQTITADSSQSRGNRFTVNDNGLRFAIEFQTDFTGDFTTITVEDGALSFALNQSLSSRSEIGIPGLYAVLLGGPSGTLDQLATGGTLAGLDENTSQAIRVVDEALGELTRVEGHVDGFYNAAITSASTLMTDLQTTLEDAIDDVDEVDDTEELLLQAHYQTLANNAVAGLTILNQQRAMLSQMLLVIAGLD